MDTTYVVNTQLAGLKGEILADRKGRRAFRRLVNILCGFFVVRVDFLHLYSGGDTMQVAAPAALPSRKVVETRYRAHYGPTAVLPDFAAPEVLQHCATRLRNFSDFIKDLQQGFTNWLNHVKFAGGLPSRRVLAARQATRRRVRTRTTPPESKTAHATSRRS